MTISFPDGFLWGTRPPRTRSRAATGTTTGGSSSTPPGAVRPSRRAMPATTSGATPKTSSCSRSSASAPTGSRWSGRGSSRKRASGPRNALDHYRRMVAACRDNGLLPVVTFHHFTTPRWAAADGGWDNPEIVSRFARFCERAAAHLGDEMGMGCTINEPNVVSLIGYRLSVFPPGAERPRHDDRVNENLKAAHRAAYDAIKSGPGDFPLGSCVCRWAMVVSAGLGADARRLPPHARGPASRSRAGVTTSSECRRTRAPG